MNWWIYMVRCSDETLCTGITNDLDRRMRQHNAGKASKYTRSRTPVKLEAALKTRNKGTALRTEAAIKRMSRSGKLILVFLAKRKP